MKREEKKIFYVKPVRQVADQSSEYFQLLYDLKEIDVDINSVEIDLKIKDGELVAETSYSKIS